ncbi:MAG: efflux RND transporter periplasmic adaptor subunit [Candidatus Aminicenantes bacterium]|nr:efflux RND transporter periplasmic adaptor subunit [Candidatus Aminicenantes bacterium]
MNGNFKQKFLTKKNLALAAGVLVLGYVVVRILLAVLGSGGSAGRGPRGFAVAVEVAPVETGSLRDVGQFAGTLVPKSEITVAPKISGRLNRLLVDIGDTVGRGQLVAVLEDEEYQQQYLQAEADINVARANLEDAKSSLETSRRDLERARTLHQKGIQSDQQLDAVVAQHEAQESRQKVAAAQLANKEAALETARVRLSYTRITVTWERGSDRRYVGERFVDEGALLSPNTPLLSIIELHPLTAVVFVTEKDYFRLKLNQKTAVASSAFPGRTFEGRVVRIAPMLKEASRQARVEIEIQNPEKLLKPGMFINTQIEFARHEKATIVPFSSLVNRDGRRGVFLADFVENKALFTPVTVGFIEGEKAEILDPPLPPGHVVTLGHHLLEDGANILLPQKESPAGKPEGKSPGKKPRSK